MCLKNIPHKEIIVCVYVFHLMYKSISDKKDVLLIRVKDKGLGKLLHTLG